MTGMSLPLLVSFSLFLAMLAALELGFRLGLRHATTVADVHEGTGTIDAAVFALLGLLLGFTFAGSTSRLDARRQLAVQEANAIGTAYLRLDVLAAEQQPDMRRLFREYLDARLGLYEKLSDRSAAEAEMAKASRLQRTIWQHAVAASRTDASQNTARLLLPAINEMIDITTARSVALQTHLPPLIFVLLVVVAMLSALLAGYAMVKRKVRSRVHVLTYAAVVAITVYALLDLEFPRVGLIRVGAADKAVTQLRDSIR